MLILGLITGDQVMLDFRKLELIRYNPDLSYANFRFGQVENYTRGDKPVVQIKTYLPDKTQQGNFH